MTNQIIQQIILNSKNKAIISLIVGIISVIHGIGPIYNLFGGKPRVFIDDMLIYIYKDNLIIFLIVSVIITVIGISFGKFGLKSTKKRLAISGIILSIFGLLGSTFFYLFIRIMVETM